MPLRSNVAGAAYLVLIVGLVMLSVGKTKFVHPTHGLPQILVLKLLIAVGIIGPLASLVSLYLAYWKLVGRPVVLRWLLKFTFFPFVLCQTTAVLSEPLTTSMSLLAVLFLVLTDGFRLLERGALNVSEAWAKRHDNQYFENGRPKSSSQLYGLDVFAVLLSLLLVLPRLIA